MNNTTVPSLVSLQRQPVIHKTSYPSHHTRAGLCCQPQAVVHGLVMQDLMQQEHADSERQV